MYTVERLLGGGTKKDINSTVDRPLDHLVACHGRIEERLQILERAAAHLESKPEEARQAIENCFRYFESNGVLHTADEEESVFPRLQEKLPADEFTYIEELEKQHREADRIYADLKPLPETAEQIERYRLKVTRFCELYRAHIASENVELIGMASRALAPEELSEISLEMKRRRNLV